VSRRSRSIAGSRCSRRRACPVRPRARLRAEIGLDLRIALCAPTTFGTAFAQTYPKGATDPVAPTEEAVFEHLLQTGAVPMTRRGALDRISHLSAESRLQAALRLGYVQQAQVAEATAHLVDLPLVHDDEPIALDRDAAAHAGPDLWRARRCAPLGKAGRALRVVTDRPLGGGAVEVIRRATGSAEVTARYVASGALDLLVADLPSADPASHGIEEHLLGTGLVPPQRAAAARRRAAREMRDLVTVLLDAGMLESEDVVEAAAISSGRPWIHVDRCSPDVFAVDALDEAAARS
jgi:hypothetical protein